ncbi:MAG: NAD+ synthase [Xanthomonadales bacterium]|nr:NAD+ synthase [Xanthomonadales bacterium]
MIRIALAQQDFPVGDMTGNLKRINKNIASARDRGADLILFPEMAVSGYPPEDLLLRPGFMHRCHDVVEELVPDVQGIDVIVGHPWSVGEARYNAVSWIRDGAVLGRYFKQALPNYAVFDGRRYFSAGEGSLVAAVNGCQIGVIICEDAWVPEPAAMAKAVGAQLLLVTNASPFRDNKLGARTDVLQLRYKECGLPIIYSNLVGGQDELVFDGRSMLMSTDGKFSIRSRPCEESLSIARFEPDEGKLWFEDEATSSGLDAEQVGKTEDLVACIYVVLVRGLKDYIVKNGFSDVVLGLSGGIDSALTLALAVDALGAEHVHAVMMPSRHTSDLSLKLAREQAEQMGVAYREISIEGAYEALLDSLEVSFEGCPADVTEENLQARARGNILMALSNKFGWMVLATGNKSELAVGYSTIYGDMCGGFSPIKDCLKTRVYALCNYRNTISAAIPQEVIDRPPSAELAPDQLDQDNLPAYDVLDEVLFHYIEQDWSIAEIVDAGFDEDMVRRVAGMVLRNEYKRRQSAPGVRITSKGFGRDRRYPITSGWHEESVRKP